MMLGRRGYQVVLAEAADELGGRVVARGPVAGPRRVDPRGRLPQGPASATANVEVALGSPLTADEILSYDFDHVGDRDGRALAQRWRGAGASAARFRSIQRSQVLTPDDLMDGVRPARRARRRVRRRPLLHGRRALRAARGRRSARHTRDARGARVRVDREHHGAGADPAAGCWRRAWTSSRPTTLRSGERRRSANRV